jgi:hypothetical protein
MFEPEDFLLTTFKLHEMIQKIILILGWFGKLRNKLDFSLNTCKSLSVKFKSCPNLKQLCFILSVVSFFNTLL